jgi:hypothetical protein
MTIKSQDDDDNNNKNNNEISKEEPEIVVLVGGAGHDEEEPDILVTVGTTTTVEDQHPQKEPAGTGSDTGDTGSGTASTDKTDEHEEFKFPNVFYCPITQKLLEDPVVAPNGDSYERSAILVERGMDMVVASGNEKQQDQQQLLLYYPNRALKSVMEETKRRTGEGLHAGWMRWQHGMQQTLSQAILPPGEFRPLPEAYYCPITFHLIHDPVIDPEGNTYERVAIENWIRANSNSPITRTIMSLTQLYPNHAIHQLLAEEKQQDETTMHPSIRQFKTEAPPQRSDPEVGGNLITAGSSTSTTTTNASTTLATTSTTTGPPMPDAHRYPTTYTELDEQRRQRRRATAGFIGLVFAAICLAAFIIYRGVFFLMLFVISLAIVFSRRQNHNTN